MTAKNEYFYTPPACSEMLKDLSYGDTRTTRICDYSGDDPDATTVWLLGDSHAQQWQGVVFDIARERGWRVTTSYLGGCPPADVGFRGFRGEWAADLVERCRTWSKDVAERIAEEAPDLVITAMASRQQLLDDGSGRGHDQQFIDGLHRYWDTWTTSGTRVLALADPPYNAEVREADCLTLHSDDPLACARPRAEAQPPDPVAKAAEA
ncbi:hypothetical protein JSY13_03930 [Microbacterium neungamense]|nr:hypothetical protein JSY13_03930 [Microbacterium neungamense]